MNSWRSITNDLAPIAVHSFGSRAYTDCVPPIDDNNIVIPPTQHADRYGGGVQRKGMCKCSSAHQRETQPEGSIGFRFMTICRNAIYTCINTRTVGGLTHR